MYTRMYCDCCIIAQVSHVHDIQPSHLKWSCQNTVGVHHTRITSHVVAEEGCAPWMFVGSLCVGGGLWSCCGTAANRGSGTATAPCGVSSPDTCCTAGCMKE